jgi:hypothetical protein
MGKEPSRSQRKERRADCRRNNAVRLAAPWIALVGPNQWAATILNISASGVALASGHEYPRGFETWIEFRNWADRTWHTKRIQVVHCTPKGKHAWQIGALFVEPFTVEEFQVLFPEQMGNSPGIPPEL